MTNRHLPSLTVGVPTRNRLIPLLYLLDSLTKQTLRNFELIISDDGTLFDIQKEIRRTFPALSFSYLRGPRINLPANRANIMRHARTPLVVMCDDDHYLGPDCLDRLYRTAVKHPRAGIVSAIWPRPQASVVDLDAQRHAVQYRLDLDALTVTSDPMWRNGNDVFGAFHRHPRVREAQFTGGGCLLYRKEAVAAAGGFPTYYSVVSFREDTDMSHRIFLSGYNVLIQPRAIAFHHPVSDGGCRDHARVDALRRRDARLFLQKLAQWRKGHLSQPATRSITHQPVTAATCSRARMMQALVQQYYDPALALLRQLRGHEKRRFQVIRRDVERSPAAVLALMTACAAVFIRKNRSGTLAPVFARARMKVQSPELRYKALFAEALLLKAAGDHRWKQKRRAAMAIVTATGLCMIDEVYFVGTTLHDLGCGREALPFLRQAARSARLPKSERAYAAAFCGDIESADRVIAQRWYNKSLSLLAGVPSSVREAYVRASLCKKTGQYARARKYFLALVTNPDPAVSAGAYYHVAAMAEQTGDKRDAIRYAKAAIAINRDFRSAREILKRHGVQ